MPWPRTLESALRYRGYRIYHDGHEFVAEEEVTADALVCEMGSQSVDHLMRCIDDLYDALESDGIVPVPVWFQAWLDGDREGRISLPVPVLEADTVQVDVPENEPDSPLTARMPVAWFDAVSELISPKDGTQPAYTEADRTTWYSFVKACITIPVYAFPDGSGRTRLILPHPIRGDLPEAS